MNVAIGEDRGTAAGQTIQSSGTTVSGRRAYYTRDALGRATTYSETDYSGVTVVYGAASTYNYRNEVTQQTVDTVRGTDTYVSITTNDYKATLSGGVWTGGASGSYMGGAVTHSRTTTTKNGTAQPTSDTVNAFTFWDGARISTASYKPNISQSAVNTSSYYYDSDGHLASVYIHDGRPRTVTFIDNAEGQVLARDEADSLSTGDPRELHYYFNGVMIGDVSNNGASTTDYAQTIAQHAAAQGTGPFAGGSASAAPAADFDQSYDPLNGLDYAAADSRYIVQDGDTLGSIAQSLWGDANLWYKLADANGLTGSDALVAGQSLIVPTGVQRNANTASTFRPYDPGQAQGDLSPVAVKPPAAKNKHCGAFGQILTAVIAVAVSALLPGIGQAAGAALGSAIGGTAGAAIGTAVGYGLQAGLVSAVSQGVDIAVGLQDKFNWSSVATSALTAGIGKGLQVSGAFGKLGIGSSTVAQGALTNAAVQGIEVASGIQSHFDWAGVAAAGLGNAVGNAAGNWAQDAFNLNLGRAADGTWLNPGDHAVATFTSGLADGIAQGATRSVLTGTDFGDNILATLPSVIGNTIGNLVAEKLSGRSGGIAEARQEKTEKQVAELEAYGIPISIAEDGSITASLTPAQIAEKIAAAKAAGADVSSGQDPDIVFAGGRSFAQEVTNADGTISYINYTADSGLDATYSSIWIGSRGTGAIRFISNGDGESYLYDGSQSRIDGLSLSISYGDIQAAAPIAEQAGYDFSALQWAPFDLSSVAPRAPAASITLNQLDQMEASPLAAIGFGVANMMNATPQRTAAAINLGEAANGLLLGMGGMAGARVPGINNQLEFDVVNGENGTHANSRSSTRTTYLYELQTKTGEFLKYGISVNPNTRYSNFFMGDKDIYPIASGTRADMLALERQMVIANPGPLNREPWAVKARGGK